jgi:hypothetical protein
MSYKDPAKFARGAFKSDADLCTKRFIQIVANDPHLDYNLSRLLALFATPMPRTTGGYAHHDGLES